MSTRTRVIVVAAVIGIAAAGLAEWARPDTVAGKAHSKQATDASKDVSKAGSPAAGGTGADAAAYGKAPFGTRAYENPISGLDAGCADRDPYLTEAPGHTFYVYYAAGPDAASNCHGSGQNTYWVFRTTDPAHWPSRKAGDTTAWPRKALTLAQVRAKDKQAVSLWGAGAIYDRGTFDLFYTVNEVERISKSRCRAAQCRETPCLKANATKHPAGTVCARTKSFGLATSKQPQGPFVDHGILLHGNARMWYYAVHPFRAGNGRLYLYFANHWKRLVVRQFSRAKHALVGPQKVVLDSGQPIRDMTNCTKPTRTDHQPWERCVLEHSEVFYSEPAHRYFLLYNAAGGATVKYAIGYATSTSPMGPFHRATAARPGQTPAQRWGANPLVSQRPSLTTTTRHSACGSSKVGFFGPGAPNVFQDGAKHWWLFYRFKTSADKTWSCRDMALSRIELSGEKLHVTPTLGKAVPGPQWPPR